MLMLLRMGLSSALTPVHHFSKLEKRTCNESFMALHAFLSNESFMALHVKPGIFCYSNHILDSRVVRLVERMGSIQNTNQRRVLCMDKVDLVAKKSDMLKVVEEFKDLLECEKHLMISGLKGTRVKELTLYLMEKAVKRPWDEDPFSMSKEVMKNITLEVVFSVHNWGYFMGLTMYHFISGYTALVAGIEEGVKEFTATFSACFGSVFIMLHPTNYGSGSHVILAYTKKIIDAIHSRALLEANYTKTEVFGLEIQTELKGVPSEILNPTNVWSDKDAHKETLVKLGGLFKKNFERFLNYKIGTDNELTEQILAAGPSI